MLGAKDFIGITWFMFAVAAIAVGLRVWIRFHYYAKNKEYMSALTVADWFLVGDLVFYGILTGMVTWLFKLEIINYERMPDAIYPNQAWTPDELLHWRQVMYASTALQVFAIWAVKATFLAIFYDIVKKIDGKLKTILHVITGFTFLSLIVSLLSYMIPCYDKPEIWRSDYTAQCSSRGVRISLPVQMSMDVLTDLMIMAFPVYLLQMLQLPRRERYAVLFIIAVGSISPISAVVRFGSLYDSLLSKKMHGKDYNGIITVLIGVEIPAAMIAACLPSMRVFFRRFRGSSFAGSSTRSSGSGSGGTIGSGGGRNKKSENGKSLGSQSSMVELQADGDLEMGKTSEGANKEY